MASSDFYQPTDIDALRMENELLTLEIRFLKARLNGTSNGKRPIQVIPGRSAEQDMISLLQWVERSPFGLLLRPKQRFRRLKAQYLPQQAKV